MVFGRRLLSMERTLLLLGLLLGAAGFGASLALNRPSSASFADREKPFWFFAFLLPVAVFLATLPAQPPFSGGGGFGRGFLVGAICSLVAAFLIPRGENSARISPSAPQFLAVVGAALVALWNGFANPDAWLGAATGWGAIALILSATPNAASALELGRGAAYFAALCALGVLGFYRDELSDENSIRGLWSAAAIVVAALPPVAVLLGDVWARKTTASGLFARMGEALFGDENAAHFGGFILAAILFLAAAALLALNILREPAFLIVALLGVVAGILVLVLERETENSNDLATPLGLVTMLAAFMTAFGVLQGYGAALMLLGAAIPIGFANPHKTLASSATRALFFGLALVIYRIFASRYGGELRGESLTDNYALFGFLAGALWPLVAANFSQKNSSPVRLALRGILALVGPGALILFYGAKIAAPFLVGVALSCAMGAGTNGALWAVLIGLSVAQWTGHLAPLADMTRAERLKLLAYVAGGGAFLLVLADIFGRINARRRA